MTELAFCTGVSLGLGFGMLIIIVFLWGFINLMAYLERKRNGK